MIESLAPSIAALTNSELARIHPRHKVWQLHIDDAERFVKSGQHRKARQKLRAALREAAHFGDSDERLPATSMKLIALELQLNDGKLGSDEALSLANDAVRVNKNCYGDSSEMAARCLLNVGVLLEYHTLFNEANTALAEAVEIARCQNAQTQAVKSLLCHALYNRAALLWSHQTYGIEPAEVLTLADEAYRLGAPLYEPGDRFVAAIKKLIEDIKLDENIWDDDNNVHLLQSGSHLTLPEGSIAAQLAAAGESLPAALRNNIVGLGREAIPELISILENDLLALADAPGDGYILIHAVELLSDLRAPESAESMLKVLFRCDWLEILHEQLRLALKSFGAAVLEPGLKSYTAAENQEQREAAAAVLAGIGVCDPRILTILLEVFIENSELGAGFLAEYGDPVALPQLSAALDGCRLDAECGIFANQDVIEIADAIEVLGGTLTESQANLLQSVHMLSTAYYERG